MTTLRRTLKAAAASLVPASAALAQSSPAAAPPVGVWGRLDWDDLLLRFAVAGMLVFFCNMVCSLLSHTFSDDNDRPQVRRHFRSFLHRRHS